MGTIGTLDCGDAYEDEAPSHIDVTIVRDVFERDDAFIGVSIEVPGIVVIADNDEEWDFMLTTMSLAEAERFREILGDAIARSNQLLRAGI